MSELRHFKRSYNNCSGNCIRILSRLMIVHFVSKGPQSQLNFLNNSVKNNRFSRILACEILRKRNINSLQICPPHLSAVAILPREIQKIAIFEQSLYELLIFFALLQTRQLSAPVAVCNLVQHLMNAGLP